MEGRITRNLKHGITPVSFGFGIWYLVSERLLFDFVETKDFVETNV